MPAGSEGALCLEERASTRPACCTTSSFEALNGGRSLLAFIERAEVIEKILTHLGLWPTHSNSPPESSDA